MPTTPAEPGRLPRPLWIALGALALLAAGVGLQFGLPVYRQQLALQELERAGGRFTAKKGGPKWLRKFLGDDRVRVLDRVTEVWCSGTAISDTGVSCLSGLKDVKCL